MNWNEAIILFIYPSRSRPKKFQEGLDSIKNNLARPELTTFVFTVDEDDPTLEQYLEIYRANGVIYYGGTSTSKIHAVNRSMQHAPDRWDIVVVMSDDMRFIKRGFDNSIRNAFANHFPDGDGCAHFPDQNQGENCMTMNITDRKYYERFAYVYHDDYTSVECDLENQEVAKMLGRYAFVEERIFDHLHPSFGQTDYDPQYNKTESHEVHEADKATRRKRKAANYGLIPWNGGWKTEPRFKNPVQPIDKPRASIVSKYAFGDEVWFIECNEVCMGSMAGLEAKARKEEAPNITLIISKEKSVTRQPENYCFPTKEELINHLIKQ